MVWRCNASTLTSQSLESQQKRKALEELADTNKLAKTLIQKNDLNLQAKDNE